MLVFSNLAWNDRLANECNLQISYLAVLLSLQKLIDGFSVADSGKGLSDQVLKTLDEAFFDELVKECYVLSTMSWQSKYPQKMNIVKHFAPLCSRRDDISIKSMGFETPSSRVTSTNPTNSVDDSITSFVISHQLPIYIVIIKAKIFYEYYLKHGERSAGWTPQHTSCYRGYQQSTARARSSRTQPNAEKYVSSQHGNKDQRYTHPTTHKRSSLHSADQTL